MLKTERVTQLKSLQHGNEVHLSDKTISWNRLKFLDEVRLRKALTSRSVNHPVQRLLNRRTVQNFVNEDCREKFHLKNITKQSNVNKNTAQRHVSENLEIIDVLDLPDPIGFNKLPMAFPTTARSPLTSARSSRSYSARSSSVGMSTVLERVTGKRRIKHNLRLEEWHRTLSDISQDVELQVIQLCTDVARNLEESWSRQNESVDIFSQDIKEHQSIQSREVMLSWGQLEEEATKRRMIINHLESRLFQIEQQRIERIRTEFNQLSDYLNKHSHLSPKELNLVFLGEILHMNAELLSNQRQVSTLIKNLRTADLVTHRKCELTWMDHKRVWQQLNTDNCINNFINSMKSEEMRSPQSVQCLLEQLASKHSTFRSRQQQLLDELGSNMIPPDFNMSVLDQWIERTHELCAEWDENDQKFLQSLYSAYENHSQQCIDQLKALQTHLVQSQYVDSIEVAGKLLHTKCLPVLGQLQRQFEQNLNYLDQCFTWSAQANLHAFASPIYRFGELLAKFWNQVGVQPTEARQRLLLDQLAAEREAGVTEVEVKDELLNQAIDALRQSATEEQVDERLNEVLRLLDQIKGMYETTRDKQLVIINQYPAEVLKVIEVYEVVCQRFFGVVRTSNPDRTFTEHSKLRHGLTSDHVRTDALFCIRKPEGRVSDLDQLIQGSQQPSKESQPNYSPNQTCPSTYRSGSTHTTTTTVTTTATTASTNSKKKYKKPQTPSTPCCWFRSKNRNDAITDLSGPLFPATNSAHQNDPDKDQRPPILEEIRLRLNASGILGHELPMDLGEPPIIQSPKPTKLNARKKQKAIKPTADPEVVLIQTSEDEVPIPVDKLIAETVKILPALQYENMVHDIKRKARDNFLEHFEEWRLELMDQVQQEVELRKAEVMAYYDLQIHLHEPRIRRSREDVANVRRTELVLHQARIDRHVDRVRLVLSDLQTRGVEQVNSELDTLQVTMVANVQDLVRAKLTSATKSAMLRALKNKVIGILDTHMNKVREKLRTFRQELENNVQDIRNSNMALSEALRLFKDGGNFAVDEAKRFRLRLNELNTQITNTEEMVAGKLESIERERQSFTELQRKQFEQELRFHIVDVTFAENVVRCVTNAIVQIKANVADSESQKQRLQHELTEFDAILFRLNGFTESRAHLVQQTTKETLQLLADSNAGLVESMTDTAESPQLVQWSREEKIIQHEASAQAVKMLTALCTNSADRCLFLNCLRMQTEPAEENELEQSKITSSQKVRTVKNASETSRRKPNQETQPKINNVPTINQPQTGLSRDPVPNVTFLSTTHISRAGRSTTDDACIRVVRSIMKEQAKHILNKDEETKTRQATTQSTIEPTEQGVISTSLGDQVDNRISKEEAKPDSIHTDKQSISSRSQKQMREKQRIKENNVQSPKSKHTLNKTEKKLKGVAQAREQKSSIKGNKIERYYLAFGSVQNQSTDQSSVPEQSRGRESDDPSSTDSYQIEQVTLLGRVRRICRENLTATLQLAEAYYRQKGLRRPTRPKLIPLTLDEAANSILSKLHIYYSETENYRDNEVRYIRQFLGQLEDVCARLPALLTGQLVDDIKLQVMTALRECTCQIGPQLAKLIALRQKHIDQLRPYLGSPSNKALLEKLNADEEQRQREFSVIVKELHRARRSVVIKYGRRCISQIGSLTDSLIIRFDRLTCEDNIEELPETETVYTMSDMLALKCVNILPPLSWSEPGPTESPLDEDNSSSKTDTKHKSQTRGKQTFYGVTTMAWDTEQGAEPPINPLILKNDQPIAPMQPIRSIRLGRDRAPREFSGRLQIRLDHRRRPSQMHSGDTDTLNQTAMPAYCVVSAKTTLSHLAVLQSRDTAVKDFEQFSQILLDLIDKQLKDAEVNIEAWQQEWKQSLQAVQDLFRFT